MAEIAAIALAFFIVAVSPGPANIALATVAMSRGRRAAMVFGAGLGTGLALWGVLAAAGFGAILQTSATVLMILKSLGGAYLLWLAFQSGRAALGAVEVAAEVDGRGRWFWRGVLLNLSNPKVIVAWMAALSFGLGASDSMAAIIGVTAMCMGIGFANYAGYALAFSVSGAMSLYAHAGRWINGAVAGIFGLAGLGLLRSAVSR